MLNQQIQRRKLLSTSNSIFSKTQSKINYEQIIQESYEELKNYISTINDKVKDLTQQKIKIIISNYKKIIQEKQKEIKDYCSYIEYFKGKSEAKVIEHLKQELIYQKDGVVNILTELDFQTQQNLKHIKQIESLKKIIASKQINQKRLMKQNWKLEQDIKDIYYQENNINKANSPPPNELITSQNEAQYINKVQKDKMVEAVKDRYLRKSYHSSNKTKLQVSLKSIKLTDTKNIKKDNNYQVKAARFQIRQNHNLKTQNGTNEKQKKEIYNDLRQSIRQFHQFRQQEDKNKNKNFEYCYLSKLINPQYFRIITSEGIKIVKQLQKLMIDEYNTDLKQIDQTSFSILKKLFQSPNAIRVLEIILFNYAYDDVDKIKKRQAFNQSKEEEDKDNYQIRDLIYRKIKPKMEGQIIRKFQKKEEKIRQKRTHTNSLINFY